MARKKKGRKESSKRISEKIGFLRNTEAVPQKQAVAEAINMEKSGRLGRHGKYRHAKRRGRRSR